MEKKLQQFLDEAFRPYGNFPARKEVEQELLANLNDKYKDLKAHGKSDDEAYRLTVASFGDVAEIVEQVQPPSSAQAEDHKSLHQSLREAFRLGRRSRSKFASSDLRQSDLSDTQLVDADFSFSAIEDTNFDNTNLTNAKFRAAALKNTSFKSATLTNAVFAGSDTQGACFDNANLTNARFHASALKGVSFTNTTLRGTAFKRSDVSGIAFDNLQLDGTLFDSTSPKGTTFKNTVLSDVTFRHCDAREANFDGAKMDKVTYALLKGAKADLAKVVVQ